MNAASAPATITFHFSQEPVGFTVSDVAAVGGTISGLAPLSGDPRTYTAIFNQTPNWQGISSGFIFVASGSYTAAAGTAPSRSALTAAIRSRGTMRGRCRTTTPKPPLVYSISDGFGGTAQAQLEPAGIIYANVNVSVFGACCPMNGRQEVC